MLCDVCSREIDFGELVVIETPTKIYHVCNTCFDPNALVGKFDNQDNVDVLIRAEYAVALNARIPSNTKDLLNSNDLSKRLCSLANDINDLVNCHLGDEYVKFKTTFKNSDILFD